MWFLAYLYVFTLILLPFFKGLIKEPGKTKLIVASAILEKGFRIYLVALPLMISETILRPLFPGLQNLVWDWANFVLYLTLFFYGFLFAANDRILENIGKIRTVSLVLGAGLFLIALGSRMSGRGASLGFLYPAYDAPNDLGLDFRRCWDISKDS